MASSAAGSESKPTDEPHLALVDGKIPYHDAVVSWDLPEVKLLGEDQYADFDFQSVTHVVLQVSDARQRQVFAQIGIKHDYNYPYPFWFFLGKMVSQALFEKETSLDILSFTRVNDREFVGFENKDFHKDNSSNGIKVIEVNLKRPHPNEPVEIFWRPARGIIVQRLREWLQEAAP